MNIIRYATLAGLSLALPVAAYAQSGAEVSRNATVSATATIQAIDREKRSVTLRNEKGEEDTFVAGPEVVQFERLKVGDTIRATYTESVVLRLRRAGSKEPQGGDTVVAGRLKETPGALVSTQTVRTVTVKSVDPNAPSITVITEDGQTLTRKVQNKANLESVKPGDRIDITISQALLVNVAAVK
jgi:Cu/Ag efflux protein CusF